MTPDRLAEIERTALKRRFPGPWTVAPAEDGSWTITDQNMQLVATTPDYGGLALADSIAAARTDIPRLLHHIGELGNSTAGALAAHLAEATRNFESIVADRADEQAGQQIEIYAASAARAKQQAAEVQAASDRRIADLQAEFQRQRKTLIRDCERVERERDEAREQLKQARAEIKQWESE